MKRPIGAGLVALACIAAGLGWWWKSHSAAAAAPAAPAAPVVQIKSELPRTQSVARTLEAIGDVSPGQSSGLSFARAGQITALSVVAGDRVAKGAAVATLVPDPATRQAFGQAQDTVALALREWERQKQLLASRLATQSQVDAAEKAYRDAQGAVKALVEQGGGTASSTLVAPFDGVVSNVLALQGDRVQAGAPVLQVARADALRVIVGIEPSERAQVHVGTRLTLRPVSAASTLGDPSTSPTLDLLVSEVQDSVDPKTQLAGAVALLPRGPAARWAAGMKVQATLQVGSITAIALPRNAVLTDERGDYVFQVQGGQAHRVQVTRLLDNGTLVAISGLADKSLPVVVEGNYELHDGMAVKDVAP
jgi:membrane fusion protein (multidrug efflux system)